MGMVGKEDANAESRGQCQVSGTRKLFWRSASWSSSRTASHNPDGEERDCLDPNGNIGSNCGQTRRFPVPLTPRSQQNCKARSSLPPLQPLSIARRSLDEWPKAGSDDIGEWAQPPTPSGRGDVNKSGERLKLDLSTIQRNSDSNGGLVKRDKIAFFDKKCSKVAEHIYLGGDAVARDRDILKQNGITHVLNCVGFVCPEYFKSEFVYRTLWLQDSPSEDITSILYDVFDYFEDVREKGGRVFVHCCQGVSRSTSLVIAYLMWREGQSFDDAFQYVKAARGIADPNIGFSCQLLQCQKRVHAFPLSPSSLLRMYRIAPHSPYDPLHLVPKMLNDPSSRALDSRGAFIIHVPSAIYVWIGKNCEAIMERDARGAVSQIARYERVQGPIIMIKEGEEPAYFWDTFSNLLPLMDKSSSGVEVGGSTVQICPGERKVDLYDVDFEIFQKAIMGGFVPPFASSQAEHETHLPARESNWSVLRRKFASGNMKEFVSATKLSLSRVYLGSTLMAGVDNFMFKPSFSSANSLPSSSPLSSSSSSPPYLSPDSISSDSSSSSKYFSESPLASPRGSYSLPPSSTLSTFSNLSLVSTRNALPNSNNPEFLDLHFTSQPCSQSVSSSSKRSPLSLAERRGSLSKTLKLPMTSDDIRVMKTPSSFILSQEDVDRMNRNSCTLRELRNGDNVESKCGVEYVEGDLTQQCKSPASSSRIANVDPCPKEASLLEFCDESVGLLGESQDLTISSGMGESHLAGSNLIQPLVCHWPSLEKIPKFGRSNLDSRSAFVFFAPNTCFGKNEYGILYVWLGRSFDNDNSRMELDSSKELRDLEEIDWSKVGLDFLTQTHLPKDTTVEIIKEGEEPAEFLAMLTSL